MMKRSIHQEDIIIKNIYTPNIGAPTYVKQILADLRGEIDKNTMMLGAVTSYFNTHPDNQ